jgi:CHAT domain-containing protein/tetratricopeptide (TPR) repeat protein
MKPFVSWTIVLGLLGLTLFVTRPSTAQHLAGDPWAIYDSLETVADRNAALEETSRLIQHAEAAGDSAFLAWMTLARGRALLQTGDRAGAEVEFDRALAVATAISVTAVMFRAYYFKTDLAMSQGHMDKAREISRHRLALAITLQDKVAEGWARAMLAHIEIESGRPDSSHVQYLRALPIAREHGLRMLASLLWNGLGRTYGTLAQIDSARVCYERALAIARDIGYAMGEAHAINNLGTLEYEFGDLAAAAGHFDRAAELAAANGDWPSWTRQTLNRANALVDLGQYGDADSLLGKALRVCEEQDMVFGLAEVHMSRAWLELARGRSGAAVAGFRKALPLALEVESATAIRECLVGLADALCRTDSLGEAIAVIDSSRRWIASESTYPHLSLVAALAHRKSGDPGAALANAIDAERSWGQSLSLVAIAAIAEQARALAMLGRSDSVAVTALRAVDAFEQRRSTLTKEDWREALGSVFTARLMDCAWLLRTHPVDEPWEKRMHSVYDALERLRARTLVDRLQARRSGSEFALEITGAISLAQLQSQVLREQELLLETFAGQDSTYVVAVTRHDVRMKAISSKQLTRSVRLYNGSLANPESRPGSALRHAQRATLGEWLLGHAADLLENTRTLIVAPDGGLAELSMATLTAGSGTAMLIDRFEISSVPSATVLAGLRQGHGNDESYRHSVAVIADINRTDLTGPALEAQHLADGYRGVSIHADPEQYGRGTADSLLASAQVIHLAAHVEINTEKPWQSGVRLAPERIIRAGGVAAMPLNARLVVLSGCESAGGRLTRGEGVLGLTSAFLAAGVPCVVATLWPVDDRVTVDFVDEFYRALSNGRSAAAALREAQIAVRDRAETSHPFFWAAFVAIGDGDVTAALVRQRRWPVRVTITLAAIVVLVVIVVRYARDWA